MPKTKILICILLILTVLSFYACTDAQTQTKSTSETAETVVPTETLSGNPLIDAGLQERFVLNGSGTKAIGYYACIKIPKATLKALTLEEYTVFCETIVKNIKYNWISIICDDGTGIQFTGSQYAIATYGTINYEGVIIDEIGDIKQTETGFIYEEYN